MTRQRKLIILVACLALLVGLFALKITLQLRRGEEVFWLAELWAPSAVLSVGLVTCIEFMMNPGPGKAPAKAGPKKAKKAKR
jgi:hypothetical protein